MFTTLASVALVAVTVVSAIEMKKIVRQVSLAIPNQCILEGKDS